jgi:hypothetical protein
MVLPARFVRDAARFGLESRFSPRLRVGSILVIDADIGAEKS